MPSMREPGVRNDYHSLLNLHHSMLLRRSMRGGPVPKSQDGQAVALLDAWPQRLTDQRLLRESLALVEPFSDTAMDLYTTLFRDGPHLRPLFPSSLVAQRDHLVSSMLRLIGDLDKPEVIVPFLEQLGQAHRRLGVRAIHFEPFGAALLEALRTRGGIAWRTEHDQAWQRTYRFVTQVMSNAAQAALATPAYVSAAVVHHQQISSNLAILRVRPAQPYAYQAGQYATLESPYLPNTWRCYSMANPPSEDGLLEFHVRATGAGQLSDVLVNKVNVGDELRLGPARGSMTLAPTPGNGVLLIAGGTGLAAVRALLGELALRPSPPPTWLFFGARTWGELYDLETLEAYNARHPWLRLVLSIDEGVAYPYESGTVVDVVARRGSWAGHDAYLCGPSAMVTAMKGRLAELGVQPDRIWHD